MSKLYLREDFLLWGHSGETSSSGEASGEALTIPPCTSHLTFLDMGWGEAQLAEWPPCKQRGSEFGFPKPRQSQTGPCAPLIPTLALGTLETERFLECIGLPA